MKILVVDDDDGNRRLASRMLKRNPGYAVQEADGALTCLAMAQREHFDAVLLDIGMPDMDGTEVCRRLRKMPGYATTCIIACTAHAGTRDRDDFLQQGFSSVLTKPFLLAELFAVLPAPMDT